MSTLSSISPSLLFIFALLASWLGVGLFLRWSLRRKFFDVPNERSSHTTPTPRGGGLVIVIVTLVCYVAIASYVGPRISWGYIAGAILIAGISWIDDLYSLPFWSRLIAHLLAAGLLVADLGYWREVFIPLASVNVHLGDIVGLICTLGWIAWLVNAYNFMDGIDGIAALQAVVAGAAWAFFAIAFDMHGLFMFGGVIACASGGFLIHNWQPARIFMGDVGSAFLGFTLAAMPLLAQDEARSQLSILPVVAGIFVWFFVFDTLVTFFYRAIAGQRVWEAHRQHLYQRLVIKGNQHASITFLYGSAAALLSSLFVLSLIFSGIFIALAVFSFVVPTFLLAYCGFRNKD